MTRMSSELTPRQGYTRGKDRPLSAVFALYVPQWIDLDNVVFIFDEYWLRKVTAFLVSLSKRQGSRLLYLALCSFYINKFSFYTNKMSNKWSYYE